VRKMINEDEPSKSSSIAANLPPFETRNERHIREIEERDARWEAERAEERKREMRQRREQISNRRLDELESQLLEVVKCCITATEGLENELARVTAENADLKLKQTQLETALAELRLALATGDRKAILDLPNPLARVN